MPNPIGQRVKLDGHYLVVGSGESYRSEVVLAEDVFKATIRTVFGEEANATDEDRSDWAEWLDDPDNWDEGACMFVMDIGETDHLRIYRITETIRHEPPDVRRYQELAQLLRNKAEGIQSTPRLTEELHYDVPELICVLARLLEGKEIHKAFGAPGDWGYSHPIGKALQHAYSKKAVA